jgi:amino acid adenylation domain-containing protein
MAAFSRGFSRCARQERRSRGGIILTVSDFVAKLHQLGVELWAEGELVRYSAPKNVLTATLRAEMARRKVEILQFLRETNRTSCSGPPPVSRVPRDRELLLSFAQQRLWFIDKFDPDNAAYNVPVAIRLTGALCVSALDQSLNEIARRHEVLRTTYRSVNGAPTQVIHANVRMELVQTDLSGWPIAEREEELQRLLREQTHCPFDLEKHLPLRAALVRLGENEHILLLVTHHIASDGWSSGILFRELSALYGAFCQDNPSPLEDLPIQYADYALWQKQWLQGDVLERQLSYWKKQLQGITPLQLPTDRPRPSITGSEGKTERFTLTQELTKGLKEFSRCQEVTLFMTLLAAFQTLLHRYARQDDIAVGVPTAGRTRMEVEGLIGFFINTLVLRSNFGENPTFRELLASIKKIAWEAYDHQDLPFEKLVEELQPQRSLSQNPLFQVMFQLRNYPTESVKLPGITVEEFAFDRRVTKFDLSIGLREDASEIKGSIEYPTDLFDGSTIRRIIDHFRVLLEGIVANPDRRIAELPLLTDSEKHQLLIEWNDTNKDYPKDKCIHQLFEEQVERTPGAIALVFEGQQLNYRELNNRANQLAHYLRAQGVGPEDLVGICVEPSLEMVIGMLGVLKAGGAYVPLDPSYPKERLAYMLEDADARLILTRQTLMQRIPRYSVDVVCFDRDREEIAKQKKENPAATASAHNLAYVIYTSGSTGTPKGVLGSHQGAVNRFHWMWNKYRFERDEACCQKTSLNFVDSVWEIFGPLLTGVRNVIIPDANVLEPSLLVHSLCENKVTRLVLVPSLLQAMLTASINLEEHLAGLKYLITSGEALPLELCREFLRRVPQCTLLNLYGSSEVAADSTCYDMRANHLSPGIPIGRPIDNTRIFILDGHLNPVPIGVTGELYIGGDGLARGYLNRPELTAEKFIPNPFSHVLSKVQAGAAGSRLYRTGDLACHLPDGNIEFLGRIDNQVKVRGFRIELGEVEAVLRQHPAVRNAVMLAREHKPDESRLDGNPKSNTTTELSRNIENRKSDKQLVAYIVPRRPSDAAPEDGSWAELEAEQVTEWQTLWDHTFAEADEPKDPTTNTAGVNSSYTNSPIPADESRDWVEHAAQRILSLKPQRVLDIGCGLGRTLFRVAPFCSRYWGVDFSQTALDYVNQHLDVLGSTHAEIKLIRGKANDLSEIPAGHFDTVVINGVTQYFPHVEHLIKVVEGALRAVEPGGVIFVGDVRSLPLLEAFQLSVELYRASDELPAELLWEKVRKNVAQEEELLVDPLFFSAIRHRLTKIDGADVLLKRGWGQNELTRFRYDAILYVKPQEQSRPFAAWIDWRQEKLTLSTLRERLLIDAPATLGLSCVPNARVLPEYRAVTGLARGNGSATARLLRDTIETTRAEAFHPEAFWALQDELPYRVDITWSNAGGPECFDVLLWRRDQAVGRRPRANFQHEQGSPKPWHLYAHNPAEARRNQSLESSLRSHMKKKVPGYMIPSAFVFLDSLPQTPNGKVNRKGLPEPNQTRPELNENFVAPRYAAEKTIAEIWADLLSLDTVGVYDNFFDLGGHSLLAAQVMARIRNEFRIELPLRTLFECPTVAGLTAQIAEVQAQSVTQAEMTDLLNELESLSDDDAQRLVSKRFIKDSESC